MWIRLLARAMELLLGGRGEGDELPGLEPRLDDHHGVERPVATVVPRDEA